MVCDVAQTTLRILCLGNALHGDDGLGEAVFEAMQGRPLPDAVSLMRVPFVGVDTLPSVEGCERLLIVDALQGFGAPGSVHVLRPDDIAEETSDASHGEGLGCWLARLPAWLEAMPDIEVIGVEAARMRPFSPGLSAEVAASVDAVCERLLERAAHG